MGDCESISLSGVSFQSAQNLEAFKAIGMTFFNPMSLQKCRKNDAGEGI